MFGFRRRRGRGPGRPIKPRRIEMEPVVKCFSPISSVEVDTANAVYLYYDEFEALRLADYLGLTHEKVASRMGVSRGTVWRLIESGRKKLMDCLVNGKMLIVIPRSRKYNTASDLTVTQR